MFTGSPPAGGNLRDSFNDVGRISDSEMLQHHSSFLEASKLSSQFGFSILPSLRPNTNDMGMICTNQLMRLAMRMSA
jgi:hypothetical protein